MTFIPVLILLLCAATVLFFNSPRFGRLPQGKRLERIRQSPNYRNGSFQNLSPTPDLAEGASTLSILREFLFTRTKREPADTIPSVRTNLKALSGDAPQVVWFGHSSYLLRMGGRIFLIDPVLSGHASPVSFFTRSYTGTDMYSVNDLPHVDAIILTHDHYDHLDYQTMLQLKDQVAHFYVPLGVGEHLNYWGIEEHRITELDWWDSVAVTDAIQLTAAPARHFSGRSFKRVQSLWASYIIRTNEYTIYLGGDSGYDTHFKQIGEQYGPFDLAMLECGQYNDWWPYIHMMPEEVVQAATDLRTKVLMPVHWGKFTLALHTWNEPIQRLTQHAAGHAVVLTTPLIGEVVTVGHQLPDRVWWKF